MLARFSNKPNSPRRLQCSKTMLWGPSVSYLRGVKMKKINSDAGKVADFTNDRVKEKAPPNSFESGREVEQPSPEVCSATRLCHTFGGALEARQIDASDGKLSAEVTGEVEEEDGVLVIRRIHVAMRPDSAQRHPTYVVIPTGNVVMIAPSSRASVRLSFAFLGVNERYRDVSPTIHHSTWLKTRLTCVFSLRCLAGRGVLRAGSRTTAPAFRDSHTGHKILGRSKCDGRGAETYEARA